MKRRRIHVNHHVMRTLVTTTTTTNTTTTNTTNTTIITTTTTTTPTTNTTAIKNSVVTRAGVLIKRNPVILKDQSEFEREYFKYQHDTDRRLARPFNPEFYFKRGTDAEKRWATAQMQAGAIHPDRPSNTRRHDKDLVTTLKKLNVSTKTTSTTTNNTSFSNDWHSLDRLLHEPLFLVVRNTEKNNGWMLPSGTVGKDELLHEVYMHDFVFRYFKNKTNQIKTNQIRQLNKHSTLLLIIIRRLLDI
jgi:hypothetical protein